MFSFHKVLLSFKILQFQIFWAPIRDKELLGFLEKLDIAGTIEWTLLKESFSC